MTKYAGSDLAITFNSVNIGVHGASLDVDEEHPAPDVTSFGDDDGTYVGGGVTDRKATFDGFDDTAGTIFAGVAPGTSSTLLWYPQGNSAGKPSRSVTAIVTKRSVGLKIRDKVALKVEFQLSGTLTAGTV